jgi:hypothetical protein
MNSFKSFVIDPLAGCPSVFDQKVGHVSISALKQNAAKFKTFSKRKGLKKLIYKSRSAHILMLSR